MRWRLLSLVLGIALLLPGCLGIEREAPRAPTVQSLHAPYQVPAEAGTIAGIVVGPNQDPLPEANVFLATDPDRQVRTAADGSFRLTRVPAGLQEVRIEAEGHIGATFEIPVRANETSLLTVALPPRPPAEGTHETMERAGLIDCRAHVAGPTGPAGAPCPSVDDNARTQFELPLTGQTERVLAELVWDPQQPLAEHLSLEATVVEEDGRRVSLGQASGGSVLRLDLAGEPLDQVTSDGVALLRLDVGPAPAPALPAGAAIEQPFILLLTVFRGGTGEPDHSALPG